MYQQKSRYCVPVQAGLGLFERDRAKVRVRVQAVRPKFRLKLRLIYPPMSNDR